MSNAIRAIRPAALAAALLCPSPASAACVTVWQLLESFPAEAPILWGRHHADGKIFMLTASEDGVWTALIVVPGGCATIVASGYDLNTFAEPPGRLNPLAAD
jgi:hypothetical protein